MKTIKKLIEFLTKKQSGSTPLLIIKKDADVNNIIEYKSIEEAISDLENDPNTSAEKIEKLRSSLNNLRNKSSIKIRNGEIISTIIRGMSIGLVSRNILTSLAAYNRYSTPGSR